MAWNMPEGCNDLPGGPFYEEPDWVYTYEDQWIYCNQENGKILMSLTFGMKDRNDEYGIGAYETLNPIVINDKKTFVPDEGDIWNEYVESACGEAYFMMSMEEIIKLEEEGYYLEDLHLRGCVPFNDSDLALIQKKHYEPDFDTIEKCYKDTDGFMTCIGCGNCYEEQIFNPDSALSGDVMFTIPIEDIRDLREGKEMVNKEVNEKSDWWMEYCKESIKWADAVNLLDNVID